MRKNYCRISENRELKEINRAYSKACSSWETNSLLKIMREEIHAKFPPRLRMLQRAFVLSGRSHAFE